MPDYGTRMPPYFSGEMPQGILGHTPYGWAQQPHSSTADSPFNSYFPSEQFVYERLDWQKFKQQLASAGMYNASGANSIQNTAGYYSNPPFMGAGQMTGPNGAPSWMKDQIGGVKRILRGYLRRQHIIPTQPESYVRLYFMYNPDQVQRQYLSWSDDTTADPTNQLGQDSSSAPTGVPSLTTLSFTLYFDRQLELMTIEDHPGVMVDLQTFDVLSGNMVYTTPSGENVEVPVLPPGMALPDNTDLTDNRAGQYQPRVSTVATTLTAVFSPSLAVEGVLSGASATFTKFSSRMTPSTMALNITLMVQYVGKNNNQSLGSDLGTDVSTNPSTFNPTNPGFVPPQTQEARNNKTISGAAAAVDYAESNLLENGETGWYSNTLRNQGPPCNTTTPTYTDAASFIWRSFYAVGWTGTEAGRGDLLGLGSACGAEAPTVGDFVQRIMQNSGTGGTGERWKILMDAANGESLDVSPDAQRSLFEELRKGDVLIRKPGSHSESGHIAFFYGVNGDLEADDYFTNNCITILHSPSGDVKANGSIAAHQQGGLREDISPNEIWRKWNIIARPEPWGLTTDNAASRAAAGTGSSSSGSGASGAESGVLTYNQTVEAHTGLALDLGTSSAAPDPIRLSPAAIDAWNKWREKWGGPIPCTSGWRDPGPQQAAYDAEVKAGPPPYTHAPAAKSYHCKGLAVDIHTGWLNNLSASEQSRLRIAAREAGWGQARWRVKGQGQNAPYEAACNADKSTDTFENWHFSVKGCG